MSTARDQVERAVEDVCGVLHVSPTKNELEGLAELIELELRKASREHEDATRRRLEEVQANSQKRLLQLLTCSPAVIYSFNATGDFRPTFVSQNINSLFGYNPIEYLEDANFWRDRVHPEDLPRVEAEVAQLFENGTRALEYRFRRQDGSYCWVNDEQHLIRDDDGNPSEIVGSWSDISTRKQAEDLASATQVRLMQLLGCSPAVIYSFNATGDFKPTFVSENINSLFGYSPGEYLEDANFWRDRVHPEDLPRVEAEVAQLFENGARALEYRFRRQDGSYCWVNDEQHLIRDDDGNPSEIVGSWSDISTRKQAEDLASAAHQRLKYLSARSPSVIYSFEATGDYKPTFISSNVKELLGYEPDEYLAHPDFWQSHVHPEDLADVLKGYSRLFEEGRFSAEYRFRKKDGNYCWIGDEQHLERNEKGDPIEVIGAWSDVTARRRLGEALVAAQDRLVHLVSSAPSVIYSFEAGGDYKPTFISQNIETLFGYKREEYLERPDFWRNCVHPDDLPGVEAEFITLFKKGLHTVEYRFLKKDGTYSWVSDEWHLIHDKDGRPIEVVGSWSDITARKDAERALERSEQRLKYAMESTSEGFSLYDAEDKLVVCNSVYGHQLYPVNDAPPVQGTTFETIIRAAAKSGLIEDAKGRVDDWVAERLAKHRNRGGDHVEKRHDGRWLHVSERKTTDGGTVAVYTNITELKQAESALREKSEALEVLSSKLSKYLSPQVYSSIFTGKQNVELASSRKKLTVLFSDIAGFTETADRLESEELTNLLNHYLTEMSKIALEYGATIDKYIGDAIVIFFGDPETRGVKEDAIACVKMAIAMRNRLNELQSLWRDAGIAKPLQCRIGINTGYCTVGNFGSEDRMDYTIIGGGVNLASRLESAATPGEIFISYETYANVKDEIYCKQRGQIEVKGIAYPIDTYQVIDLVENVDMDRQLIRVEKPNLKLALDIDAMSAEERNQATQVFSKVLDRLSTSDDDAEITSTDPHNDDLTNQTARKNQKKRKKNQKKRKKKGSS